MDTNGLLTHLKDHVGTITLNRPEHKNTFTVPFAEALNAALVQMDRDPEVRVVVMAAAGKHFSTGIDLDEFSSRGPADYQRFITLMDRHNHTIAQMETPVIAAVRGYAVANGAGLAFAADMTVAADNARFGTTAINVGLICTGPAMPLLQLVGRKKATELVLTGRIIDATEALSLGLVNSVVPDDELETAVSRLAGEIASKSPLAVQAGKRAITAAARMAYPDAIDYGSQLFSALCTTEDAVEGVAAFRDRRTPQWRLR